MDETNVSPICKVFISYTDADHKFASKLYDEIERNQMQAFMYKHTKTYDQDVEFKITSNLQTADYVVAIITENSNSSASVNQEIGYSKAFEIPFISMCHVDKCDQSQDDSRQTNKMPKPYDDVRDLLGIFTHGRDPVEFTDLEDFSTKCSGIIEYMKSNGPRYLFTPEMQKTEKTSMYRKDIRNTVTNMVMLIIVDLFKLKQRVVGYAEYPNISDMRKWQNTFKHENNVKDMLLQVTEETFIEFEKTCQRLHDKFLCLGGQSDMYDKMFDQEKFMIDIVYRHIITRQDDIKINLPDTDKTKHLKFDKILEVADESGKLDLQLCELSAFLSGLMCREIKLLSVIKHTENKYGNEILWDHRRDHMYDV